MSRICKQCCDTKPLSAFYSQPRRTKSTCITCLNRNAKSNRKRHAESGRPVAAAKTCSRCKVQFTASSFARNKTSADGLAHWCKDCYNVFSKERKQCIKGETEPRVCLKCGIRKEAEEFSAENRVKCKVCRATQKRLRYSSDERHRLRVLCRNRVANAIKAAQCKKHALTIALVGCSWAHLRQHLEGLFTEGMTWDNQGFTGWHIDHIIPIASFDLSIPEQQSSCFHYTNLQPLWASENMSKGCKVNGVV